MVSGRTSWPARPRSARRALWARCRSARTTGDQPVGGGGVAVELGEQPHERLGCDVALVLGEANLGELNRRRAVDTDRVRVQTRAPRPPEAAQALVGLALRDD